MKKISRFATLLVLAASFATPLFASAQNCTTENASCTFGGQTGTCLNNGEGDFYCNVAGGGGTVQSGIPPASQGPVVNTAPPVQPTSSGGGINTSIIGPYAASIINFINGILVPILMAIAFIVFLWGVFKYFIWGAESDTERDTGKQFVLWGIIGFVVILSVWGIVNIVKTTFIPSTVSTHPAYPTL